MTATGPGAQRHARDFVFDDRDLPLIRVTWPDEVTLDAYEALVDEYVRLCRAHPRLAWVLDMRDFNPLMAPAPVRKAAAAVFERARADLARSTVCEVRIVGSVAVRGVLMAFDWITGHKWPVKNVGTLAEAEAWAREQLAR